jgi:hypothetical protein
VGRNAAARLLNERYGLPLGLLAAHVVLGFLMALSPAVSTAHAVATALVVLWIALFGRRLEHVALVAGYAALCDVPWRVTDARFFYEGGKYLVAVALAGGLIRLVRTSRLAALPIGYFGLLLPSAVLTLLDRGAGQFREIISFNLSGPLALAVAVAFFLQIRMSWVEVRGILLAALGPALALLTVVTYRESQIDVLTFGSQSDFQTSGGFGPNQVSTALAVGAMCCLLLVLTERRLPARLLLGAIGLWFFGQGVFTFSRGGLYDLAGAALCILFVALGERSLRWRVLRGALVMTMLSVVVFACLNAVTDGALSDRFSSTDSTGRDEIAAGDLDLFIDNPLAGVGPGMAQYTREGKGASAHTEFSRMLAEHGVLGLAALGILVALIASAVRDAPTAWGRAVSLSLTAFAALAMTNTAMRSSAPAFLFGLGMARIGPTRRSPRAVVRPEDAQRTPDRLAVEDPARQEPSSASAPRN